MTKVVREISPQREESKNAPQRAPRGRGRHWGRWLMLLLVIAGGIVFFLPTFAGWAVQSPETLAWVSGQPAGTIEIGEANFSWQGPVQLKNVTLQARDGHTIANVDTLTAGQTFWGLLTQQRQTLKLNLDGVRYTVTVPEPEPMEVQGTADVSQFTSALEKFVVPCPNMPMEVTITHGAILFQNPRHEPIETWSDITATYHRKAGTKQIQTISATVPAVAETGVGELILQGEWEHEKNLESISLKTQGDHISLVAASPWLEKYLGPGHGLTTCSGEVLASFERDASTGWNLEASAGLRSSEPDKNPGPSNSVPFHEDSFPADQFREGQPASGKTPAAEGMTLQVQAQYVKEADELRVPQLLLSSAQTAIQLHGHVTELSGAQVLQIQGEARAPGAAMMDLLPLEVREQIQIEGIRLSQFEVTGALRPAPDGTSHPLMYALIVGWDKAQAYGLESQQAQLKVSYHEGLVRVDPINVPVNGGKLLMLPTLDLRAQPATLHFQAGTMLENVALTEEICRDWLMYISPTLANATSAEGRLTLVLNQGQLPLGHPEKGDVGGVLTILNGSVRPGPLAVEVLHQVAAVQGMLNRGGADLTQKAFLTMTQENINFRLYQGRVYHENFGANVGEMRIATAGSMGLDHTLEMGLSIAFPQKWLAADRPVLQALAGEPIQLTVAGTLEEPRIDGEGLAEFGKQIGIKAGVGLLEKLLERRRQKNR